MTTPNAPRILILGATSEIAESLARLYAEEDGARFVLAGRTAGALEEIGADLSARGASDVRLFAEDLANTTDLPARFAAMAHVYGGLDLILILFATLADQTALEADPACISAELQTNLVAPAQWAICAANMLEAQKSGVLAAGGALAGDRGRRSNYIYGAGKAGIATLMQGIAHRLHGSGARACVIKFGPVATPLTAGVSGCADPTRTARSVKRALTYGAPAAFYAPGWWRLAMWPIRLAPDFIMHRTRL
jgi:decaprenylphospho-beta-D-erythro-pentofuranosid-2-ulose 2-reductase